MSTPEKDKTRKFRAAKRMREIMTEYYIDANSAAQTGRKVAWITSGGPVEPLIVMDVIPVYPENYGAMIGASHMGGDLSHGKLKDKVIYCPVHGSGFDITNGKVVKNVNQLIKTVTRAQTKNLNIYPVNVDNGEVWVEVSRH